MNPPTSIPEDLTMDAVCPKCLTTAAITVDVTDGDRLHCPECDEDYSLDDVIACIESWTDLLPWLKSHPARTATPECVATK